MTYFHCAYHCYPSHFGAPATGREPGDVLDAELAELHAPRGCLEGRIGVSSGMDSSIMDTPYGNHIVSKPLDSSIMDIQVSYSHEWIIWHWSIHTLNLRGASSWEYVKWRADDLFFYLVMFCLVG